MATAELVVTSTSVDSRSTLHTTSSKTYTVPDTKPRENPPIKENDTGCFSLIREALMHKNIQGKAASIILESWRGSTRKQYDIYIQKGWNFQVDRKLIHLIPL